jgi:hypothetical protein
MTLSEKGSLFLHLHAAVEDGHPISTDEHWHEKIGKNSNEASGTLSSTSPITELEQSIST